MPIKLDITPIIKNVDSARYQAKDYDSDSSTAQSGGAYELSTKK
jgi:hypothetical protein